MKAITGLTETQALRLAAYLTGRRFVRSVEIVRGREPERRYPYEFQVNVDTFASEET